MDRIVTFTDQVMRGAKINQQRTGQYLFNQLPGPVASVVASTLFDPFHKELNTDQVFAWLDQHIIFDGDEIVGVFNGNALLWER